MRAGNGSILIERSEIHPGDQVLNVVSPEMLYNSWQPETSPLPFFAQQFEMETVNGDLQVITP